MTDSFHATTIIAVRRGDALVFCGDGQVSMGSTIMKGTAQKVRTMIDGRVLCGFAGATADAFTLFEKFEAKLKAYNHNLVRSCVELAKDWRTDRYLRKLEALLLVGDAERTLLVSGTGDVIEPDGDVIAIGSGGSFALSAARALVQHTELSAEQIAHNAMSIAADICVYTNHHFTTQSLKLSKG